jgi:predicted  nucleic acid-binding Zn-ribbon protein
MKEQLTKIEEKLDKVDEKLSSIDVTLARQAKDLEHHIYRTSLAEENIELLRIELQPVKKHVALVDAGLKLVGALASATAFVLGVIKILFN